ncbi:putative phytochrome sensor protein [[Leptolyngbya] sp. PCC 7376]|uniref:SAV_2336 N-terminal domain-related protein n=1 Tax=[Leptolyngbya] sp. PCC 7376 TaxID=111781 RepID=UPI00029F085C|nr:SAV_2336 N-terminal domain-related protein [[Leptolyngbya] sp. PCC 7376]AFY39969.1 putative phytochrome sensor protein [[Leptolyngbya] sp. PCC 7376]
MSKAILDKPLEGFITTLGRSDLLLTKNPQSTCADDLDIADMLWLAQQIQERSPDITETEDESSDDQASNENRGDRRPAQGTSSSTVSGNYNSPPPKADITTQGEQSKFEGRSPQMDSLPIRVPKAPTFLKTRLIRQAFRPLRRKVPSKTTQVVDVDKTVEAIAERLIYGQEFWSVETKPERERWLNVELVIEVTESNMIWQEMIDEFQKILETHGAFRKIRVWNLKPDRHGIVLESRHRSKKRQRKHRLKELCHPERRSMILLVSDCTSALWEEGKIYPTLHKWSQSTMLGLVQLFPESRWQSTWLDHGQKFFAKSSDMGSINSRLKLIDVPNYAKPRLKTRQDLFLPILTMEWEMIYQWCRVQSGNSMGRIPLYVIYTSKFYDSKRKSKPDEQSSVETVPTELTPEMRVNRFLATALIPSQQLAGLMSAVPVDMSVVNLIRKTMLKDAAPQHVAEVFMGGLMEADRQSPGRYDFVKGVRKILNGLMRRDELLQVLDELSIEIGKDLNRQVNSFMALLTLLPSYSEVDRERVLPFARVSVEVLSNLGGEYSSFARQVKLAMPPPPLEESNLLEYEFETAVFQEKQQRQALIDAINALSEENLDLESIFSPVRRATRKLVNAARSTLWILDHEQNDLWAKIRMPDGHSSEIRTPIDIGYAGKVVAENLKDDRPQDGYILNIQFDLYDDPDAAGSKTSDQRSDFRTCSLLCMPIFNPDGELIGVIQLVNKEKEGEFPPYNPENWPEAPEQWRASFSADDEALMRTLNTHIGEVLQKALLLDQYPQWKTLEFETVDLIIEDTVTFEFETARFVGEELERETKTTEGLIEILKEGYTPEEMATYEGDQELEAQLGLEMVRIPAGTFVMGAPESDRNSFDRERPQHLVTVPEFYLGRFLVTQEQWREVASWEQIERKLEPEPSESSGNERYPVEQVSWLDAKEFCARLSQRTEREYRLPSEAEWEYACRAIASFQSSVTSEERSPQAEKSLIQDWNENYYQPYSYGDRLSPEVACYNSSSPVAVGSFLANGFGIYDMPGNVYEWCEDDWHDSYQNAPTDESAWLDKNNSNASKVRRGGDWVSYPWDCRSAYRVDISRDFRDIDIGFRVACR